MQGQKFKVLTIGVDESRKITKFNSRPEAMKFARSTKYSTIYIN